MGKRIIPVFILVSLVALSMTTVLSTRAASRTITVPDNYSTISAALRYASSGDTVYVKKGTYAESTLVISRAVTLMGEDAESTVINNIDNPPWDFSFPPPPPTVAVQINADDVKISGFTITGAVKAVAGKGDGAQITGNILEANLDLEGNKLAITGNNLTGNLRCSGAYNNIMGNSMANTGLKGIELEGHSNIVRKNKITGVIGYGGIYVNSDRNEIAENNITNSTSGIYINNGSDNIAYRNRITENAFQVSAGLILVSGFNNTFYANYIANNTYGAIIGGAGVDARFSSNTTLYHNSFVGNSRQVRTDWKIYGSNFWDNGKEGNFWSDYVGNDTNNDGIGDTPYIIDETRKDNYPLMFPFDIENNTIVRPSPATEPAPTNETAPTMTQVAVAVAIVASASMGLAVYVRKRRLKTEKPNASTMST